MFRFFSCNPRRALLVIFSTLPAAPAFCGSVGLIVSKYGSAEATPFIIGILALGVLIGLLAYNLFLAITTREVMFGYFSAIMILLSILQAFSTYDRFFFYLTYNRVTVITHTLFIVLLLFFQYFFTIPRHHGTLSSWNRVSILVIAGYTFLFLTLKALTPRAEALHGVLDFIRELFVFYTNGLFIANILLAMAWMKTEGVMILVAFIPPALLTSLNAMNIFPFMAPYQAFTTMMMQYNQPIGLSLQAILLSLAVGNRYNRVNAERLRSADERDRLKTLDREKTEYYMNLSHELRTPLTIILGLTEQLKGGKYGDSIQKNRKTLDMLERNGMRLLKQIQAMLKIESPKIDSSPAYLPLDAQLRAYMDEFRPIAEKRGLKLNYEIPQDQKKTALRVNPEDCDSLVLNLLSNAVKYTPSGGLVSLEVDAPLSAGLKITVKDTGPGIPREFRDTLFDRFKRVGSMEEGGTGLGLPVVRKIIRSYNGEVLLSENNGGGSAFTLSFPEETLIRHYQGEPAALFREDLGMYTAEFGESSPEKEREKASGPVILIVEDNRDMIEYVASILSSRYRLLRASGGTEALDILEREAVDMIISDVMMKPMDGH
ncbi:MAG: response regulator, partial [Spirochaetales bacterium]|nr:response regulator [Spirochaetales bacterium]